MPGRGQFDDASLTIAGTNGAFGDQRRQIALAAFVVRAGIADIPGNGFETSRDAPSPGAGR